jgi:uncharacterized RDD family membrane protein YckC
MDEVTTVEEPEKATRLSRLGAALIDMLIVLVITMPVAYLLGAFDYADRGEEPSLLLSLVLGVFSIGVFFALNRKLLAENGQTIGKRFNKIRIVRLNGDKPELTHLVLKRYVPYFGFGYIPFIGGILSLVNVCWIFGAPSRCLHDYIADTKVVKC